MSSKIKSKSKSKSKTTNAIKNKKKAGKKGYEHIYEIYGLFLLAISLIIFMSIYLSQVIGPIGVFVGNCSKALLGITSYTVPFVLLVYSISVIRNNHFRTKKKLIYSLIILVMFSGIINTGYYVRAEYENLTFIDTLAKFINDGILLKGGGLFGGLISLPFLSLFKIAGALLILTTITITFIMLLTELSIVTVITIIKDKLVSCYKSIFIRKQKTDEHSLKTASFKKRKISKKAKANDIEVDEDINDNIEPKVIDFNINEAKDEQTERINYSSTPQKPHETFYRYPPTNLLENGPKQVSSSKTQKMEALESARKLEETLKSFGVLANVVNVNRGPSATRYELQPSKGVKVSKIINLSDDIALNMAASGVRIEAPIPGKAAVGIEIPNREIEIVYLKKLLESSEFNKHSSKISFALGRDISGECVVADIAKMPHLLIAGATGAGKSVCVNCLIISLLYKASADEVKMIMIDPKMVELGAYNGIPHMLIPVITNARKAAGALGWAVQEMENRYKLFYDRGVRDLASYNLSITESEDEGEVLPQIVIIIDELSDLMMIAPNEVEDSICRLAQMARAAGMHLVIATQRPSVDVITGIIKANIPSRISFAVTSQVDSRTILDMGGAEKLMGRGDMLYYPVGQSKPVRVQGAFITEREVERVVEYIKKQGKPDYNEEIIDEIGKITTNDKKETSDVDELMPKVVDLIIESGQASVSMIQRKFRVGYARAARIIDQMEERKIVGPFEGTKPRQILITRQQWIEMNTESQE